MSKFKFFSVFLFVALLSTIAIPALANYDSRQGSELNSAASLYTIEPQQATCDSLPLEEKVQWLAKKIVAAQITDVEIKCYEPLTEKERAQVFEAMATERGISLTELREEGQTNEGMSAFAAWQQLVEREPFSAVNETIRSVAGAWQDNNCDGDSSDVDHVFRIDFPYAQSDPDSLRSFSQHIGVDAMLAFYQVTYGGINAWGNTTAGFVYTCLGGSGVSTAGGQQTVRDHLKMHDEL